jgi:hypothetical protein
MTTPERGEDEMRHCHEKPPEGGFFDVHAPREITPTAKQQIPN